jgi:hypothetical protein
MSLSASTFCVTPPSMNRDTGLDNGLVGLLLAHGQKIHGNARLVRSLLDKRHSGFGLLLNPGSEVLADRLGEWRWHNRVDGLHHVECGDLRIDWRGNRDRIGDGLLG